MINTLCTKTIDAYALLSKFVTDESKDKHVLSDGFDKVHS